VTSRSPVLHTAMFSTHVPFGNWWIVWPCAVERVLMLSAEARVRKEARMERGCILKNESEQGGKLN